MANRRFVQFNFGLEKMPVNLLAQVAIGSTGAPTLSVANSKGIASIARNGVGKYTITLQDPYVRLMSLGAVVQNTTGIAASADVGIITSGTTLTTASGGTIVIQFSAAGVAAELASGDTLFLNFKLSNSTAP